MEHVAALLPHGVRCIEPAVTDPLPLELETGTRRRRRTPGDVALMPRRAVPLAPAQIECDRKSPLPQAGDRERLKRHSCPVVSHISLSHPWFSRQPRAASTDLDVAGRRPHWTFTRAHWERTVRPRLRSGLLHSAWRHPGGGMSRPAPLARCRDVRPGGRRTAGVARRACHLCWDSVGARGHLAGIPAVVAGAGHPPVNLAAWPLDATG